MTITVYSCKEAVIIWGKGKIIEDSREFMKKTQDHVDKHKLKLDKQGRDSLEVPLFNKKVRCIVEITSEQMVFW